MLYFSCRGVSKTVASSESSDYNYNRCARGRERGFRPTAVNPDPRPSESSDHNYQQVHRREGVEEGDGGCGRV